MGSRIDHDFDAAPAPAFRTELQRYRGSAIERADIRAWAIRLIGEKAAAECAASTGEQVSAFISAVAEWRGEVG